MSDLLIQNATTRSGECIDLAIREGVIDTVVDAGTADQSAFDPTDRFDAAGRLMTPTFSEPHTHLDSALTIDVAGRNESGTLEEGWTLWQECRAKLDKESVKQRATRVIEWYVAHGVTRIRSHVDVTAPHWESVDALLELQEELSHLVDLQLVAFPIDSVAHDAETVDQLETALGRGVDVVGGLPHGEHTREAGVEHVKRIATLAANYDRPLDAHIDETDDPNSRFTEVLAVEARNRGIGARTTASHATALHSYPNTYARKVTHLLAEVGMSVVTNPLSNSILQGRYDDFPRRRGHTRIEALRELGVSVAVGQDDIVDSTYQYGDGDPLTAAQTLLHFAQLNLRSDVSDLWTMLLEESAHVVGVESYGLEPGSEGSVVVHGGTNPFDVLRTREPRALVVKDGVPVAKGERTMELTVDGGRPVDPTTRHQ